MNNYKLNLKESPADNRDFIVISKSNTYPNTLDFRPYLENVRNQGEQGSCFAFAVSSMKEIQEHKDYNFEGYMSPQFFYDVRSNLYDDDKTNDEGMFGRDVMKILSKIGICKEHEYPYGVENSKHKNKIAKTIYDSAKKHTCSSYGRIYTINELKISLYENGPCLICMPVYNYGPKMWKKEHDTQELLGGHAMCIVGYTNKDFIIRNSWGDKWEDEGYCYYPFSEWNSHWEIWTSIDSKTKIEHEQTYNDSLLYDDWIKFVHNIDKTVYYASIFGLLSGIFWIF